MDILLYSGIFEWLFIDVLCGPWIWGPIQINTQINIQQSN